MELAEEPRGAEFTFVSTLSAKRGPSLRNIGITEFWPMFCSLRIPKPDLMMVGPVKLAFTQPERKTNGVALVNIAPESVVNTLVLAVDELRESPGSELFPESVTDPLAIERGKEKVVDPWNFKVDPTPVMV
jgi:hypothetical protein